MKKIILVGLFFLLLVSSGQATDFIVEFVEENYRETSKPISYSPVIYHSIQVVSDAGPKLLVLKGDDDHYRNWMRQYIAQGKQFIVQIPDDQDDLFISSSAFEMDVVNLHPFNLSLYRQGEGKYGSGRKLLQRIDEKLIKKKDKQSEQSNKEKSKANIEKKKADLKIKEKDAQKKELEKQQQAQKQAEQELQDKAENEKRKRDQELALKLEKEQLARDEQLRKQALSIQLQELKQRLLEDEKIRAKELEARNQEVERRWQELQQRYAL